MSDPFLNALRGVVRPEQHLSLRPQDIIHLEEKPPATLTLLKLKCLGCGDVFAFTLDIRKGGAHVPLTNHTTKATTAKWNKVCDGIFIWRAEDGILRVLVCDLKSSTPTGGDWKHQLWSSSCFVEYLISVVKRFHEPLVSEPNPKFHAVTFHGDSHLSGRNKRGTGIQLGLGYPKSSIETPARMPVSNGAHLVLKALCQ